MCKFEFLLLGGHLNLFWGKNMLNVNGVMEEYIYVCGQIFLKQFYIPRVLHFFFADDLSRNPGLEKKETLNIYSIKELI